MLLMQSDMLKAIWFMIYPAVEIVHGRVPSASPFCQTSGYFLTLGIEACDMAVLLISLHTTLNITRRINSNGLYPYRKQGFAAFVGIPLLLASLAFQNTPAFANSGEYCYLPMRPRWTRRSLSWIPRYFVFAAVMIMYVWIYVHVRLVTKQFTPRSPTRNSDPSSSGRVVCEPKHTASVPPLPLIRRHGLITTPAPSAPGSVEELRRHGSLTSAVGHALSRRTSAASAQLINAARRPRIRWKLPSFGMGDTKVEKFQASIELSNRRASSASSRLVPSLTKPGNGVKWKSYNVGFDASHSVHDGDSDPAINGAKSPEPRRHTVPGVLHLHTVNIELQKLRKDQSTSSISPQDGNEAKGSTNLPSNVSVVDHQNHQDQREPSTPSNEDEVAPDSGRSRITPASDDQRQTTRRLTTSGASSVTQTFWNRPMMGLSRSTSRPPSLASMFMTLRLGPRGSKTSSDVFLSPTALRETGMEETREALRRQTRQLLIYPLVYLAVWVCPFISHVLGGRNVPFPLLIATIFSLSIQGAADALVFALREKPWQQIENGREDEENRPLRVWWRGVHDSQAPNVGRTPDEMLVDGRIARRRLREELEQRMSERNESERHFMVRRTVDWWELGGAEDW